MTLPASSADLAQQTVDYTTVINACKAVSRCVGIVSNRDLISVPTYSLFITSHTYIFVDNLGHHRYVLLGAWNVPRDGRGTAL